MIKIQPNIDYKTCCPRCRKPLNCDKLLWQGIHVCAESHCKDCRIEIVSDLKVGHAIYYPYQVDVTNQRLFGGAPSSSWFGLPLLESLMNPTNDDTLRLTVEQNKKHDSVVILNCIDYLYGHSLLKLLNAEREMNKNPGRGVIVIIPKCLRWMVPPNVAEIWSVNVPLSRAKQYYPRLDLLIKEQCRRFQTVYLSLAHSHPKYFSITGYTGVAKHDWSGDPYRITFIWREDRLWVGGNPRISRWMFRLGMKKILLTLQKMKVVALFFRMRQRLPDALYTVAGLGKAAVFPGWIEDKRVTAFDYQKEREACRLYAQSRLVIGVHGSNMLLPSAHAGMIIDLMPEERGENIAQDIIFDEADSRMAVYRYRFVPATTGVRQVADIARTQIETFSWYRYAMRDELADD